MSLPAVPYIDKLGHFLLYAILAAAALFALPATLRQNHPHRTAVAVIIFCLLYGITDELHQAFIPERNASILDLGADFLGSVAAVFFGNRPQMPEPFLFIHSLLNGVTDPDRWS